MKMRRLMHPLLAIAGLAALSVPAKAQALVDSRDFSGGVTSITAAQPDLTYTRPTEKTKIENYLFDAFGPYPAAGAMFAAGMSQAYNTPPEWKQGAKGYAKRFGSDFGIAAISTTTRYGLAEAFRENTLYYRCECKGVCSPAPCRDFRLDSAPRRRRSSRLFFPGSCLTVCRQHNCRLCVVSRPLQRQGRASDG